MFHNMNNEEYLTTRKLNNERNMQGQNKDYQAVTSYIKHLAVSGLSSISARIKGSCNLTGKCFEMPNVSYTPR